MKRLTYLVLSTLISLLIIPAMSAHAQAPRMTTVNITAQSDKVRITAEGNVSELRVEVADESGAVVFESGHVTMQTLDWQMRDSAGERVAAGTYLLSVTFRTAEGKLRKRVEQVTVPEAEKAGAQEATKGQTPNAVQAVVNSTGTNGRIAKFTGGATLGNSVIVESASKVGIGTAAPTSALHVVTADAVNPAITGRNNATGGVGVFGYAPTGYGVIGQSTSKVGVLGTSGAGNGVSGTSANGNGVIGESGGGNGVSGYSNDRYGIFGSSGGSSALAGVYGQSINGAGVRGTSTNYIGVYGESSSHTAVSGVSASGAGVLGDSPTGYGVIGRSSKGYAGYFYGNVRITGTLIKASGSFKIDHPLDPANKYLSHSFVESPDMMNIYNGNVTLDRKGQAVIVMPSYFNALNKDFRYQLTPIGAAGPRLHIAEEITANRFKIAGGRPGMKVSWMVTGIRHDAYAEAHRIRVEEEKPQQERGTYMHPELFGHTTRSRYSPTSAPSRCRGRKARPSTCPWRLK